MLPVLQGRPLVSVQLEMEWYNENNFDLKDLGSDTTADNYCPCDFKQVT